jgi:hypothetical protein
VRCASVVQRLGAVADSVEELVEEKGEVAVVVRIRQVSALEHSDTVAKKATHTNTAPHSTQSIACACGGSNSCPTKKIPFFQTKTSRKSLDQSEKSLSFIRVQAANVTKPLPQHGSMT